MPATPVRMSIHPTTWRLRNEGLVVTANARIAPIAISASPVAVLMISLYPPRVVHSTPLADSFPRKAMAAQRRRCQTGQAASHRCGGQGTGARRRGGDEPGPLFGLLARLGQLTRDLGVRAHIIERARDNRHENRARLGAIGMR